REVLEGLESPVGSIVVSTTEGEIRAQRLIVATGKAEFKTLQERVGRDSGYVGFKMHLKLKPSAEARIQNHCDLFVFEHGYGGLSMVEGGVANFCFLIEKTALKKIGSDWGSLASHIARHSWAASRYLDGAIPQFRHPVTIAHIPYGYLRRMSPPAGMFFVGDQMAVIPSLTGDGMSIALMTGRMAAEHIMEKVSGKDRLAFAAESSRAYQRLVRRQLRSQIDTGYLVHRLFKQPMLIDYAAKALQRFPLIIESIFNATRCDLVLPEAKKAKRSRLGKGAASNAHAP
ncbi:MAG TPA: hypothetical protein VM432_11900, partial [Bdellovibrionales bacterium]|nr:hypothetical protein [Bdellovibrionales bacterium]